MARDPVTVEQARVFLAVVEEASFSAAGRRLGRAQSAISFVIATMEDHLNLMLFDRSQRGLMVTEAGQALVARARAMVSSASEFHRRASDLAAGIESEVHLGVDVLYPLAKIVLAMTQFTADFPRVPARIFVEPLDGVSKLVLDRACGLGIVGSSVGLPPEMIVESIGSVEMVAGAAPRYPVVTGTEMLSTVPLRDHLQLLIIDRSRTADDHQFADFDVRTWRIDDLGAKQALLRQGVGWGIMPLHLVRDDIADGRLQPLQLEAWAGNQLRLPFQLIRNPTDALGQAGRRLMELLKSQVMHIKSN